jgi:hypothetical protein
MGNGAALSASVLAPILDSTSYFALPDTPFVHCEVVAFAPQLPNGARSGEEFVRRISQEAGGQLLVSGWRPEASSSVESWGLHVRVF